MSNGNDRTNVKTRYSNHNYSNDSSKNKQVVKVSKKKNKNDKSRIIFLLFTVVLFIIILISTVFSDVMQIIDNRKDTQYLESKYQLLLEEEASLNSEVIKLQDPEYKARYAREKFLFTKDGETILTIIDNTDTLKKNDSQDMASKND